MECEQALQKAFGSSKRNRDILLGFQFGMTPQEVSTHFSDLRKSRKIYTTSNYGPTYDMKTELGDIVCSFGTEYFNDSLSGMYLYLQKRKNVDPSLDLPGIRKLGVVGLLQKKHGLNCYITENNDYYFINGNIVIGITDTPQAAMYYFDAPTKKREHEEKKAEETQAIRQTIQDL